MRIGVEIAPISLVVQDCIFWNLESRLGGIFYFTKGFGSAIIITNNLFNKTNSYTTGKFE